MTVATAQYVHARESLADVVGEIEPLLEKHWREVAHYQDIPLDPDWESYAALEDRGACRIYTARLAQDAPPRPGRLIGYAVFFLRKNMHYRSSLQAVQDVLFIDPEFRGRGMRFVNWCDGELRKEGVQAVYHHVKAAEGLDFGPALCRMGYEKVDHIYARRLDRT